MSRLRKKVYLKLLEKKVTIFSSLIGLRFRLINLGI